MADDPAENQLIELLQALPAAVDPEDVLLGDVLAAARAARGKERYRQRGELLRKRARDIKAERSRNRQVAAPRILERIERFHADYAVRSDDLINLAEASPAKSPGPGTWRRWLPAAILRCAWGLRPRRRLAKKVRRRIRVKRKSKGPHYSAPTTASVRISDVVQTKIISFENPKGNRPSTGFEA